MASSLELNKLLAGVLTAGIIAVGAGVFAGILYRPQPLPQHAFSVVVPDADPADTGDAAPDDTPPLAALLASADPAAGETITRQCTACHVFAEGGDSRVGPYLWNVLGRDIASVAGFNYSAALREIEGDWTYEKLDAFLANPRGFAPGTSMSYAGLRNAGDRANLIAYMRGLSHDPLPLPEADMAAAEAEPVPVEEEAAVVEEEAAPAEAEVAAADAEPVPVEEEAAAAEPEPAPAETEAADAAPPATEAEDDLAAVIETPEEALVETPEAVEEAPTDVAGTAGTVEEAPEEAAETAEAAPEAEAAGEASPMVAMVAAADPAAGQAQFRQCAACHTVDQGGPNRVGPNLWDVFGADIGHHEGFNYSDALLSLEGIWTVDKLDAYLENPRAAAPGNRMAFVGLRSADDRAAMIAYLRSLSEDPKPVDIQ